MVWCLGVLPVLPLVCLAGLTLGNEVDSWINRLPLVDFGSVVGLELTWRPGKYVVIICFCTSC